MIARHVTVTGHVQGVFFRAWTKQQADELGVAGWVRNRADGSVEAHVEGAEDAVAQLVDRMRTGPPAARVERLATAAVAASGNAAFDVRHD